MNSTTNTAEPRGASRVEKMYEQLRVDIISGAYPPGAPLRTSALAKNSSVSLSVVRESLIRLTENGLVEFVQNQGFRVMEVSREDLIDLSEVRVMMETRVLARSIERADLDWEGTVVATHHKLDALSDPAVSKDGSREWAQAHADFHDALGVGCGSPRLINIVRLLRDSAEIYRQLSGPRGAESGRDIRAEHTLIKDLAVARDVSGATQALAEHLQKTTELLLDKVLVEEPADSK